ncbi:MAG: 5-(carboxyamino)imidazole ribonucleotide synthase [Acidimicrobiales bacterium]
MSRRDRQTPVRIGIVGGGQLALMMGEAAHDLPVALCVLAASEEDPARRTIPDSLVGAATDPEALAALAARVDVITLDHELVDLEALALLEARGTRVRPHPAAVRFAADKAHQRRTLAAWGLPVPRFRVVTGGDDPELTAFLAALDGPVVVKAATGGYDGRGVFFPDSHAEVRDIVDDLGGVAVVEERLTLLGEAAQIVVRDPAGADVAYPLVSTYQAGGTCVEVDYPARGVDASAPADAAALAREIAQRIDAIGVLAVELFWTARGWLVNELALRPHNTGHWTIEGARTSQFANHLRAVAGLPLGPTTPTAAYITMVNVLGGPRATAAPASGPHLGVHDYAKAWRPGRKLGHVTATGPRESPTRVAAWEAARAWGTREEEPWHSSPS